MQPSIAYPYKEAQLLPAWRDRKAQTLAAFAIAACAAALWWHLLIALADLDHVVLTIIIPAALAFVLAFAPRPATRANRIAKDLVTFACAFAVFADDRLPLFILAVPALLAVAVAVSRTRWGGAWWGESNCPD